MAKVLVKQVKSKINCPLTQKRGLEALKKLSTILLNLFKNTDKKILNPSIVKHLYSW